MICRINKGRYYEFRGERVFVVLNLSSNKNSANVIYRVERTGEIVRAPRQEFLDGATKVEVEGLAFERNHVLG